MGRDGKREGRRGWLAGGGGLLRLQRSAVARAGREMGAVGGGRGEWKI